MMSGGDFALNYFELILFSEVGSSLFHHSMHRAKKKHDKSVVFIFLEFSPVQYFELSCNLHSLRSRILQDRNYERNLANLLMGRESLHLESGLQKHSP